MASGASPLNSVELAAALGGTFLCAASANSFNQVLEIPRDALMKRTAKRPLPSGRIGKEHAVCWASATGVAGVAALCAGTNLTTAALGAATIGLYTMVYTPLKVVSPINTWVGAVVGAIPPVMGWTAGGGPLLAPEVLAMSGALFLWQIPHFMALAWMYRADYAQGGYRMVPLTDPTGERTSAICLEYSGYLALLPFVCWGAGVTSCMFAVESLAFNGAMLHASARFASDSQRGTPHARRLFLASLLYLPLFFGFMLLHQRPPAHVAAATALEADNADVAEEGAIATAGPRERVLERGRKMCIHEQIQNNKTLCPVAIADELVSSAQVTAISSAVQKQSQQ